MGLIRVFSFFVIFILLVTSAKAHDNRITNGLSCANTTIDNANNLGQFIPDNDLDTVLNEFDPRYPIEFYINLSNLEPQPSNKNSTLNIGVWVESGRFFDIYINNNFVDFSDPEVFFVPGWHTFSINIPNRSILQNGMNLVTLNTLPFNGGTNFNIDSGEICTKFSLLKKPYAKPPLILVHGIIGTNETFNSDYFVQNGFETYVVDMNNNPSPKLIYANNNTVYYFTSYRDRVPDLAYGNIKVYSELLREQIDLVKSKTGASQVDIVAHSMGGLISRTYINSNSYNTRKDVRKLIMAGTPNHGSDVADVEFTLGCLGSPFNIKGFFGTEIKKYIIAKGSADIVSLLGFDSLTQMTPHSDFLKQLNGNNGAALHRDTSNYDYLNPNTKYHVIIGDFWFPGLSHFEIEIPIIKIKTKWCRISIPGLSYKGDAVVLEDSAKLDSIPLTNIVGVGHTGEGKNGPILEKAKYLLLSNNSADFTTTFPLLTASATATVPDTGLEPVYIFNNTISLNQEINYSIPINSLAKSASFLLTWENENNNLSFFLTDPSNNLIGPSTVLPNINYSSDLGMSFYVINNPQQGNWILSTRGTSVSGTEEFSILTFIETSVFVSLGTDKTVYRPNEQVTINSVVQNGTSYLPGQIVFVNITKPDNTSLILNLLDDGLHNDQASNDGIYGNILNTNQLIGIYDIFLNASISFGSPSSHSSLNSAKKPNSSNHLKKSSSSSSLNVVTLNVVRNAGTSFIVTSVVDLTPLNISYDTTTLILSSAIKNLGDSLNKNVTINFYEVFGEDLVFINKTTIPIPNANSYLMASVKWSTTSGLHNITASIDEFSEFNDANYSNNNLNKIINLPDTTPPLISNIQSPSITANSALITWNTDELSSSLVIYGTTPGIYTNQATGSSGTFHQVSLSGLTASTTYYYRVNSTDSSGNTAQSTEYSFTTTTPDTTPPVISKIGVSTILQTSALITWNTDELSSSLVIYGTTSGVYTNSATGSSGTFHPVSLSGLTASTIYYYRVSSTDSSGNTAQSTEYGFATRDFKQPMGIP